MIDEEEGETLYSINSIFYKLKVFLQRGERDAD